MTTNTDSAPDQLRTKFLQAMVMCRKLSSQLNITEELTHMSMKEPVYYSAASQVPINHSMVFGGLSVVPYNRFEDFICEVTRSYVDSFLKGVSVSDVPSGLKEEVTHNSLMAYSKKSQYAPEQDNLEKARGVAKPLSVIENFVSCSPYSFSPERYDIAWSDMSRFLKSFDVSKPDNIVREVARRHALGSADIINDLNTARRHRDVAAHKGEISISGQELRSDVSSLVSIAFSYEAILAGAISELSPSSFLRKPQAFNTDYIPVVNLDWDERKMKWRKESLRGGNAVVSDESPHLAAQRLFSKKFNFADRRVNPLAVILTKDNAIANWHLSCDSLVE